MLSSLCLHPKENLVFLKPWLLLPAFFLSFWCFPTLPFSIYDLFWTIYENGVYSLWLFHNRLFFFSLCCQVSLCCSWMEKEKEKKEIKRRAQLLLKDGGFHYWYKGENRQRQRHGGEPRVSKAMWGETGRETKRETVNQEGQPGTADRSREWRSQDGLDYKGARGAEVKGTRERGWAWRAQNRRWVCQPGRPCDR